jgi:large subunit ribosomal protein L17
MRHRKVGLKLNRTQSHRSAMFRNMVTSLFKHDRIRTTGAKAKELRRWADHIITLAKRGDLHARRQALAIVREKDVVHKLFENAAERFGEISGGYTRVVKLGTRPGDAAPVALVELVVSQDTKKKKTKKKKAKAETAPKKAAAAKKSAVKAKKSDEKKTTAPGDEEAAKAEKPAAKASPEKKAEVKEKKAAKKKSAEAEGEEKPKKEAQAVPEELAEADKAEDAADSEKTAKDE